MEEENIREEDLNGVFDNEYYSAVKKLQIHSGLWPFQSNFLKKLRKLIIFSVLGSSLYFTAHGILHYWSKDLDLSFENFLAFVGTLGMLVKYSAASAGEKELRMIHRELALNWSTIITDPSESRILRKYAQRGKTIATLYLGYIFVLVIGIMNLPLLPVVLDLIYPLNESRNKIWIIRAKYPVDPETNFLLIHLQLVPFVSTFYFVITGQDPLMFALVHHFIGVTAVIKHRLFQATLSSDTSNDESYNKIIEAITLHQRTLNFFDLINKTFSNALLFHIVLTTLVSVMCAIFAINIDAFTAFEFFRNLGFFIGVMFHAFYISWCAQQFYDSSSNLFFSTYDNEWYNIPQKSKVLLHIMMMRCIKPCIITAGGVTEINLYNYGVIIKSAISYTTVIISFKDA